MQEHIFTIKQIGWDHELLVPGPMWPDTTFAAIFDKHFLYNTYYYRHVEFLLLLSLLQV